MIGPDIVSAVSLAFYDSSTQTNIVTSFDDFFLANSYFFTYSNISGSLSITRFYIRTVNCIEAPQVGFAEFNNTADNRANIGGTIIGAPIVGQ